MVGSFPPPPNDPSQEYHQAVDNGWWIGLSAGLAAKPLSRISSFVALHDVEVAAAFSPPHPRGQVEGTGEVCTGRYARMEHPRSDLGREKVGVISGDKVRVPTGFLEDHHVLEFRRRI